MPVNTVLSVIIPAYNEVQSIASVVERVVGTRPALLAAGLHDLEVIVVDDGSLDGTGDAVPAEYACVRLVRHARNRGYGAALKTGMSVAQGSLLGFLDADGTYPPEALPALCRAALSGADLVVGSRRSGAASDMPRLRRLGNAIWSGLVSALGGQHVADPASGMRILHRSVLHRLYPLPDGLNFTPVMSTRAIHENLRVEEVPIPYQERTGQSKLHVLRDGLRFLRTIVWTALSYNPARPLGGLGVLLCALAGLIAASLVGLRLAGVTVLGPWSATAVFAAVTLGVAGVDLFALGVVFNYVVSLFAKRPIRQGLFGRPLLRTPLERHFWWLGSVGMAAGLALGATSLGLGLRGWPVERLWLYLLAGTMLVLVGLQLIVFWVITRVLSELAQREALTLADMRKGPAPDA